MTGEHLIECLFKSGTGETKIEPARKWLERKKGATGGELFAAMKKSGAWPEMTLEKAQHLLEGGRLDDLMGVPPPKSQEASETRVARAIGEEIVKGFDRFRGIHEDRQQDAQEEGIAHPEKIRKKPGPKPKAVEVIPALSKAEVSSESDSDE